MSGEGVAASELAAYRAQTGSARALSSPVPVSWALLAVVVLLYAACLAWSWLLVAPEGVDTYRLVLSSGEKSVEAIGRGEVWRLWTSVYLHINPGHVVVNAFGVATLAPAVERLIGSGRLVLLWVGGGTVALLASTLFVASPSVGASGPLFALVGALAVYWVRHRHEATVEETQALFRAGAPWALFTTVVGLVSEGVDHAAHVGGWVAGVGLAMVLGDLRRGGRDPIRPGLVLLVGQFAVVFVALVAWMARCGPDVTTMQQCWHDSWSAEVRSPSGD